jgi:hypothetical protein
VFVVMMMMMMMMMSLFLVTSATPEHGVHLIHDEHAQ